MGLFDKFKSRKKQDVLSEVMSAVSDGNASFENLKDHLASWGILLNLFDEKHSGSRTEASKAMYFQLSENLLKKNRNTLEHEFSIVKEDCEASGISEGRRLEAKMYAVMYASFLTSSNTAENSISGLMTNSNGQYALQLAATITQISANIRSPSDGNKSYAH